ncbi:nuclear transport factor 2 family protein [Streptomyces sp. NPDC005728]|uniref:nuclear transport factor 2 family protein n=1 Tax=Streptomyces sp. NPDC005728 TaxID=3157054 RepID=UPI0033DE058C
MADDDAAQLASAYFAAWQAKDFTTLRSLLADDLEYLGPLGHYKSADACRDSLASMAPVTKDLVVHRTFVDNSDVLTWFTLLTTVAPPTAVANWIHVEDGKIARIQALYDPRVFVNSAQGEERSTAMSVTAREKATEPEDLARIWVDLANAGDVEGLAELYEPDAVMAFPIGKLHVGREAIRAAFEEMLKHFSHFEQEEPLPTLRTGDLALTSTVPVDDSRGRYQVARRQPDGTWLRVLHSSGYFA